MKPTEMTVHQRGKGDALAACLASILEVPIGSVPDFSASAAGYDLGAEIDQAAAVAALFRQDEMIDRWLRVYHRRRAVRVHFLHCGAADVLLRGVAPDEYLIGWGQSPRHEELHHAVVVAPLDPVGFRLAHDPHPSGMGVVDHEYAGVMLLAAAG